MVYEWNEESIEQFFRGKDSVSQSACDEVVRNICGKYWTVEPVGTQGSLSYTLICTKKVIMSFRRPGSLITSNVIDLAKEVHQDLVPSAAYCGTLGRDEEVLTLYKMPCLPGEPCLALYPRVPDLKEEEEKKCGEFHRHLARYFARTWLKPQIPNAEKSSEDLAFLRRCLTNMKSSGNFGYLEKVLTDIEEIIPSLFEDWPQVLTHGDFSKTNILIDEKTFAITGLVDWSLASISPFGTDLSLLPLMASYSDDGDTCIPYKCADKLEQIFWEEFWVQAGIDKGKRADVKRKGELVANLQVIIRFGFNKTLAGEHTDQPITINEPMLRFMYEEKKCAD